MAHSRNPRPGNVSAGVFRQTQNCPTFADGKMLVRHAGRGLARSKIAMKRTRRQRVLEQCSKQCLSTPISDKVAL